MHPHHSIGKILFLSSLVWAATAVSFTARAATVTENVATTTDKNDNTGDLSLREALVAANTGTDDYVINLQQGAIYHLTILPTATDDNGGSRGDLDLYRDGMNITINGNDSVIDATGLGARIFQIISLSGSTGANVNLTLNDVTLTGGDAGTGDGGAINFSGKDQSTSLLTLNRCHVTGNKAKNYGGIVIGLGTVTLNQSTVDANISTGNGGGIGAVIGAIKMNNSTVSGNKAATGGGVYVGQASAVIRSSTISRNDVSGQGGGAGGGEGSLDLKNSILAGNTATGGNPDCFLNSMSLNSSGYNIFGTFTVDCPTTGPKTGDQTGITDPKLADLAIELPTLIVTTQRPLVGSPAIDKGDPAGCTDTAGAPLTVDERGSKRNVDGDGDGTALCDVGAVELERCGDGAVDGAEQCDGGSCCDSTTCKFKASGTACDDGDASTTNDVCNAAGTCQGTPGGGGGGGKSGGGCRLETADASGGSAVLFLIGTALAGLVAARRRV